METLPSGFLSISEAYETVNTDKLCNVIAVVVDSLAPAKTKKDWTAKLTLSDASGFPGLGAEFRFFSAREDNVPNFNGSCANGDIIVIRKMKVKNWNTGTFGLSNNQTEWTVVNGPDLRASTDSDIQKVGTTRASGSKAVHLSSNELSYAKSLLETIGLSTIRQPGPRTSLEIANVMTATPGSTPTSRQKFSLVKDIIPSSEGQWIFKEILAEVRRIYKTDSKMSIYVTDYTSHDLLYNYRDGDGNETEGRDGDCYNYINRASSKWPGPHGQKTILINLYDAHARWAHANLQAGYYVYLKNVHMKLDQNKAILEGHCRGDPSNTEKVNVTIIKPVKAESDQHLRDLIKRKRAVEKQEGAKFVKDPSKVGKRQDVVSEYGQDAIKKSKADRNKEKRNKQRDNERQQNKIERKISDDADESHANGQPQTNTRFLSNSEVRTFNHDVRRKPIHEIMDPEILARTTSNGNKFYLPFQNCRYKSLVRVVDFFPHDLTNFSVPRRESDYDLLEASEAESESDIDMTGLDESDVKWEWRFFLVVEDASGPRGQPTSRMELLVADGDGDLLLDMEACNLRAEADKLAKMKEKLWVLWGDLEELKREGSWVLGAQSLKPSNKPFECLIKEYGVEARDETGSRIGHDEYDRIFHLWGTTVK